MEKLNIFAWFANAVWSLWLRIDRWWTKKSETERRVTRMNIWIWLLIASNVYTVARNTIINEQKDFKHLVEKNAWKKEKDFITEQEVKRVKQELENEKSEKKDNTRAHTLATSAK